MSGHDTFLICLNFQVSCKTLRWQSLMYSPLKCTAAEAMKPTKSFPFRANDTPADRLTALTTWWTHHNPGCLSPN